MKTQQLRTLMAQIECAEVTTERSSAAPTRAADTHLSKSMWFALTFQPNRKNVRKRKLDETKTCQRIREGFRYAWSQFLENSWGINVNATMCTFILLSQQWGRRNMRYECHSIWDEQMAQRKHKKQRLRV